ncbi:hypothetical protein G6F40_014896 [Rhizopus arrhizus]|nr:hypothetical protein G6F40_014896 [Rhizopus arrhizus]
MALRQEKNVGDCTGRFCSSSAHSISRAMSSGTWLAMSAINAYRRGSDAARLVMAKPSLAPGGSRDPHAPPAIEGSRCILFAAIKIATSSSLFLYSRRQSRPRRAALARRSSIRLKTEVIEESCNNASHDGIPPPHGAIRALSERSSAATRPR